VSGSDLSPQVLLVGEEIDEEASRMAALTVCDPARRLSKEEASEVLKALGLREDPLHKELTNPYGSRRRA
jgi:hypothetical protein